MPALIIMLLALFTHTVKAQDSFCHNSNISVQVLGSGGPELSDHRASSGYLIWHNNKAVILIDTGGGSALRYGESKAKWQDLKAVLFTHFHADHSSDFPALVKASWFGERKEDLPVFGPYANQYMPNTTEFLDALFGNNKGAFKYLSDMYDDKQASGYKLTANNIPNLNTTQEIYNIDSMQILAHKVKHGPIPAFAYVLKICDKTLVFSGDTNAEGFEKLQLDNTDIFIAHNAIPQYAGTIAKSLHMTPEQIGQVAHHLNTKKLILSHRMNRSLGHEEETVKFIKLNYGGEIEFSNDLDIFNLVEKSGNMTPIKKAPN